MGVLSGLEPSAVWTEFEQICRIPHGSGNCKVISDFLVRFGEEHGLFVRQDEHLNVIFKKPATPGYEDQPPIILQGHMDMVAVATPESGIDMRVTPLELQVEGDEICANHTSLGGDDGIAVAMCLALLKSTDIPHPPLEVILTTEEEVGMDGARAIDLSCLEGHRLLNLDSEDEGVFLAGCAGGARVTCLLPLDHIGSDGVKTLRENGIRVKIRISGLQGGHSGSEIHRGRANANHLLGSLLSLIADEFPTMALIGVEGGLADNAIPREATLTIAILKKDRNACHGLVERMERDLREIYAVKDPQLALRIVEESPMQPGPLYIAVTPGDFLCSLPNGVQAMSADVEGFVETSLNLGILKMAQVEGAPFLHAEFSVRSSVEPAKDLLIDQLRAVTALAGGITGITGDYPGWKYRADSPLRDKMVRVYEQMYGKTPKVEAIHAGVECGLFSTKIEDLDCVSIGPDMRNIHTTEEHLSISSSKRTWEFVLGILADREP